MQLFYADDIDAVSGWYTFSPEESSHIIRVLRLKEDDGINITDGRGMLVKAVIRDSDPRGCRVEITGYKNDAGKRGCSLHIAVAPTKSSDRLEWFVEKAVELGIERITPIVCDRSERRNVNVDRLRKVAVSAMKQSSRCYLPTVDDPMTAERMIAEPFGGLSLIAHCDDSFPERPALKEILTSGKDVRILVGPEGDFSPREIKAALEAGFTPVSLGQARLRTETAALMIAAAVAFLVSV